MQPSFLSMRRTIGGCRLSRPLVRIVIPFGVDEAQKSGPVYEEDLRHSLVNQMARGDVFDIEIVFVLQERGEKIHELQDWSVLDHKIVIFNADKFAYPTTFHQVELGFQHCLDADYCMYMTANDVLAPMFIASAIKRMGELDAKVVYGDTLYVTPEMQPRQCEKPAKEFLPFEWFKDREGKTNQIPDICLLDPSILEMVPFDAKHKRAAFIIWWYRIWEELGHTAFAYVNTIGCLYRPHENHLASNPMWVDEGAKIANRWIDARPWRKYTGFA